MLSAISLALLLAAEPWVLWVNVVIGTAIDDWTPARSFHSLEACEAGQAEAMRSFRPTPDMGVTGMSDGMIWTQTKDGTKGYSRYVCLPANIEPRRRS
jgi:hypothetical protein